MLSWCTCRCIWVLGGCFVLSCVKESNWNKRRTAHWLEAQEAQIFKCNNKQEHTVVRTVSSYLRLLLPLLNLFTLVVGILQDSPSSKSALQQLLDLVHHPQVLQQLLPLEECINPLLLLHVFLLLILHLHLLLRLLLLLHSDFCSLRFPRHTGRRRLLRNIWFNLFLLPHCMCSHQSAFTIHLQLLSLNNVDNTVCFSCLDNKRYLNLKWETPDKNDLREYYSS